MAETSDEKIDNKTGLNESEAIELGLLKKRIKHPNWAGFQKGRAKTGGRVAGVPNKKNKAVTEALESVYEGLGGDEGLKAFADDNPDEFYRLWGKMIPRELKVEEVLQDPTMTPKEAIKMIKDLQKAAKK